MRKLENIHPIFERLVDRSEKEKLLNQKAKALWMTGLSGSGKSTIACGLEKELHQRGFLTQVLDGDNVRSGINGNLSFSADDRRENIRRIAEINKLYLSTGVITINCFISPTLAIRQMAREIIGSDFIEVFVDTPFEVCESRDVKGLYKKARQGLITNFTGIDAPFEAPEKPDFVLKTESRTPDNSVQELLGYLLPRIRA